MDVPRNEDPLAPRAAIDSRVTLAILTVPEQANPFGTLHGGVMLRMADECGAVSALRHVGRGQVTTAALDSMTFLNPVYVGERVEIVAEVTHVGRTSIETRIEIYAEALQHPGRRKVGSGFALYVALDDAGKRPHEVPPLLSITEADRIRDEAAQARQAIRLARRDEARRHSRDFL
ncbi:acyl-CoA thioesterase [Planctomyces sp. SH-PL62]|uniref:acyl-CoA thioesterase n=1 Tax=Planctomyces sp. SH-PL62 TaxID=1636152 RepID=UPI00078E248D|nr:acyl-CoA thioesterase [Planctomyces sp. SH-PL62]AMV36452.1 putative acyl-CoA thioester hydrolase [Planctomyces sp. SH-PL62]